MGIIFALTFAISLFLSPDFLTIFGNGLGIGGVWFLCLLILVFAFNAYTLKTYTKFYFNNPASNTEYDFVRSSLGDFTGLIFPFIVKALLAVCMGVGLLATAGYAFNELFVRWFPNMGFTLLALGVLLLIGLISQRLVKVCQLIFTGFAVLGIIILSIIGLFSSVDFLSSPVNFDFIHPNEISFIFSCFVLLMGFEMANTHEEWKVQDRLSLKGVMMAALVIGFVVLLLWGIVSLMYVSPERLSDTYIPHLIASRAINSDYGREMMGLIIIFGSLSAVNALLTYVSSIWGDVLSKVLPFKISRQRYRLFSFIILVLTIAGLLISGMAGEPEFEIFIRGSIYLWLLNYGAIHLAFFVFSRKAGGDTIKSLAYRHYGNLVSSIFVCSLYCGLVLTDHETVLILQFTGIVTCGALLTHIFYRGINLMLIKKTN